MSIARVLDLMLMHNLSKALVIGAEVLSKLIDWHDRTTAVLFGAGAGGVLLEESSTQHFLAVDLNTFGELGNKLIAGHTAAIRDFTKNKHQISAFSMDGEKFIVLRRIRFQSQLKEQLKKLV